MDFTAPAGREYDLMAYTGPGVYLSGTGMLFVVSPSSVISLLPPFPYIEMGAASGEQIEVHRLLDQLIDLRGPRS